MQTETYALENAGEILSPALIYYADLIRENTRRAIEIAGGANRLWPHVKSHKMKKLIEMQMEMGISRFKCATLAEVEMTAACGAPHVLLAYPLVGPSIPAFVALTKRFPETKFYALGDDLSCLRALDKEARQQDADLGFFIDVNMGMNRTGVETARLYDFVNALGKTARIAFCGLHCYDGHVHTTDLLQREAEVTDMVSDIADVLDRLSADGIDVPMIIAGGSPSFPCHAANPDVFLSPGTVFLWDSGYLTNYPDLPFTPAAAVLTRVVSHPADGVFTLDLGCKGIASDPAGARGVVVGLEHAEALFQSEEHWTWHMLPGFEAERPAIGTVFYVIPTHVCPTTALYSAALVAENGRITDRWTVDARR